MFWSGLSEREKLIVICVAEGKTLRDAANVLGVRDRTMQNTKRDLGLKILEFMCADITIEVRRSPRWKQDLAAAKEKMAYRDEQKHGIN
jgi:hypothetical protein